MSARSAVSRINRINQWLQFARQWHVIDANQQYKPIWHPETDCGDHVVVVNCKDVAMHGFDWKHRLYHFDKQYPKARADIPAYQIHEYDPCRIIFLAVYKALGNNLIRGRNIQRLHLLPDLDMPPFLKKNIGNQLEQVQPVVKRSDQYSSEERNAFPNLISYPKGHLEDWERPVQPPGRHFKPTPGKKDK